jgi:kinesin family protein 4/21/27
MAVKESSQRAIIDQQYVQIADLQKANNKLREELFERVSQAMLFQMYHSLT